MCSRVMRARGASLLAAGRVFRADHFVIGSDSAELNLSAPKKIKDSEVEPQSPLSPRVPLLCVGGSEAPVNSNFVNSLILLIYLQTQ